MVEREQGAAEGEERLVDVCATLVANRQATHLVQVRKGTLDHPAMPPQAFAGIHPAPGDARLNAPSTQRAAYLAEVVGLVCVQPPGASVHRPCATELER